MAGARFDLLRCAAMARRGRGGHHRRGSCRARERIATVPDFLILLILPVVDSSFPFSVVDPERMKVLSATETSPTNFLRVLLTACAIALVASLAGASPRESSPGLETRTVVFLGDSLAAGYGVEPEEAFPALVGERIRERGWPFRVVNAGVSGDTSAGGLRRVDWLLRQRIDILVLELGANDALRGLPLDVTERNLEAIVEKARAAAPDVVIVLAGMLAPPNLGLEYSERFRSIFPRLSERHGLHLVPFLLEGVGGRAELNRSEGIHPTPEGHQVVADNVWQVLEGVLADQVSQR
jgi:acyl-CoA thioesterase-1